MEEEKFTNNSKEKLQISKNLRKGKYKEFVYF